jgi:hypothetical protein
VGLENQQRARLSRGGIARAPPRLAALVFAHGARAGVAQVNEVVVRNVAIVLRDCLEAMRCYSPVVVAGVGLYIPLAGFGSFNLLQQKLIPWAVALGCFGIGSLPTATCSRCETTGAEPK